MWKIKDVVIYGAVGVCEISDIKEELFMGDRKTYLILTPLFNGRTVIHLPTFNERLMSKLKPVLTKSEAISLIKEIPSIEPIWIDNDRERQEKYKEILEYGERRDVIGIIKALHNRKNELSEKNKRLRTSDEYACKDAEGVFENECAHVFSIAPSEVSAFILSEMSKV